MLARKILVAMLLFGSGFAAPRDVSSRDITPTTEDVISRDVTSRDVTSMTEDVASMEVRGTNSLICDRSGYVDKNPASALRLF